MELYAKPQITTSDEGSINIEVRHVTPEYIDTRLAELAVFGQLNYNFEEVVTAARNSSSNNEAKKRLKATLDVDSAEADFLLDLSIEELAYYFQKGNCEAEIRRWEALKVLLAAQ